VKSDPVLKKWYRKINKRFFDNELPQSTCVRWANEEDIEVDERCEYKYNGWAGQMDGHDKQYVIVISTTLKKSLCTKLHTLVHEMCHVKTELRDKHGPAFEAVRQVIADKGIFKKSAVVKKLTLF
jgi:hypothetical protein